MTPGIEKVGQIHVTVRDLPRAEAFYRDVLGLKHLFTVPPGMAFFDCGGLRLMLGAADKDRPQVYSSIVYFVVPDIQAAFDTLVRHGVKIREAPQLTARLPQHDLWLAFFEDSEGNVMSLMAEVPRGA